MFVFFGPPTETQKSIQFQGNYCIFYNTKNMRYGQQANKGWSAFCTGRVASLQQRTSLDFFREPFLAQSNYLRFC